MNGETPAAAAAGRRGGGRPAHRAGERSTRDEILAAARNCFGERGYDRATIRDIAARATVDPALVLHYFGSKEQLFAAALEIPLDPSAIITRVMAHDRGEMGTSLVRAFLEAWEPEETRSPLLAMMRSAMTNETAMALVREFLGRRIFTPLTATLGLADAVPARHPDRVAAHRPGDGALHRRHRAAGLGAGREDRRRGRADNPALPHRRPRRGTGRKQLTARGGPGTPAARGPRRQQPAPRG